MFWLCVPRANSRPLWAVRVVHGRPRTSTALGGLGRVFLVPYACIWLAWIAAVILALSRGDTDWLAPMMLGLLPPWAVWALTFPRDLCVPLAWGHIRLLARRGDAGAPVVGEGRKAWILRNGVLLSQTKFLGWRHFSSFSVRPADFDRLCIRLRSRSSKAMDLVSFCVAISAYSLATVMEWNVWLDGLAEVGLRSDVLSAVLAMAAWCWILLAFAVGAVRLAIALWREPPRLEAGPHREWVLFVNSGEHGGEEVGLFLSSRLQPRGVGS